MPAAVQSLQRAFRLLYIVAGRNEGCSVREFAEGAGLKSITAYKLIRTLEAEGFLQRSGPPLRFNLGHAIHELKFLDDGRLLLTESGRELITAQRQFPNVGFALLQWEEGDTYQRLAVEPFLFGRLIRRREFRVHSYGKASSLLFLAHASPGEAERFYLKHPFAKEGLAIWRSQANLDHFLASIRLLGWAQPDFPDAGNFRLAVPVWSSQGKMTAAVAAYIPEESASFKLKRQLLRECRRVAEKVTAALNQNPNHKASVS